MPDFKNSSFKNFEWLQFSLRNIITRENERITNEIRKSSNQLDSYVIAIITGAISVIVGLFTKDEIINITSNLDSILRITIYILCAFAVIPIYFIIKIIIKSSRNRKQDDFRTAVLNLENTPEYFVKKFDNDICDNILLSFAFRDRIEEDKKNICEPLHEYYIHELSYYLNVATEDLHSICCSPEVIFENVFSKIEDANGAKVISISRFNNAISMIEVLNEYLCNEIKLNFLSDCSKSQLTVFSDNIRELLNTIRIQHDIQE